MEVTLREEFRLEQERNRPHSDVPLYEEETPTLVRSF